LQNFDKRYLAISLAFVVFYICSFSCSFSQVNANDGSPSKESSLSPLIFKDSASADAVKYLGLTRTKNFSLADMRGSLFVIEVFSTFCTSCPRNVPVINKVYDSVQKGAAAGKNVKVFGIAIGNTEMEVSNYKAAHNVLFPVLTDYDFSVHDTLGNPRVPYTLYIRKTAKRAVIVDTHQGTLDSAEAVLKKLSALN